MIMHILRVALWLLNNYEIRRYIMRHKYDGRYYDMGTNMYVSVYYMERRYRFTWSNGQERNLVSQKVGRFIGVYFKKVS